MNGLLHSTLQHILMKLDSYTLVWVVAICLFSCEETAPYVSAMATQTFKLVKKGREKKMDCFGTYFTHVQTCDDVRVQSATEWTASVHTLHYIYSTHVQTCDDVRVQSATEWIASVHTLYTCPDL